MTLKKIAAIAATLIVLMLSLTLLPQGADAQAPPPSAAGLVVLESTQSFDDTWASLIAALDANPAIRTIAQVDHSGAAASAGLTLESNRVVFFGNPALGTPLMQASRTTAIDLPQKMQVYEDGGRVFVAYNPPSYLSSRHETGAVATLAKIDGALAGLARAATNTEGAIFTGAQDSAPAAGLVSTTSASDFETTWTELLAAIDRSPASVAFTVDHGANSGGVLPPTRLVVFGNPAIGTPIMASAASAGIDLPLKMLVYEDPSGFTHVVSTSPGFVQSRHGVGTVPTIAAATGAIANFTAAATTSTTPATSPQPSPTEEVLGVSELAFTGSDPVAASLALALLGFGTLLVIAGRRTRP